MTNAQKLLFLLLIFGVSQVQAQMDEAMEPPARDARLFDIAEAPSPDRIESDIQTLVDFGTRNTLSDTTSDSRGIGAARRWIKAEFDKISEDCGGCLNVYYQRDLVLASENRRIPEDVYVVNVIAELKGTTYPDRYVIMSGDIDSRASSSIDAETDSPGANDNASGVAGTLEAARVLTQYEFPSTIVFAALSGEEQGLFGGQIMAKVAKEEEWNVMAILNNDMIGNIEGIDGVIDNTTFRVFSQANPVGETDRDRIWKRFYGGEVDGPSRQVARYVDKLTDEYFTNLDAMMIYRLDRFGRGGHHRPFNDEGFPGVRIMETHENYNRQHQDIREEDGIKYGDVIEKVDFDYAARLTGVNAVALASMAWAPPGPENVQIGGAVRPSTRLRWDAVEDDNLAGYKVYWRETTEAQWQYSRFVPAGTTDYTLENIVIDNYLFGVASVNKQGDESVVVYPTTLIPRR
jgi:Zn-dependent M28 family amino/carboxypeptidase